MARFRIKKYNRKTLKKNKNKYRVVKATPEGTENESKVYKRKAKKTGSSIQATIPAQVASKLRIVPGDNVVFRTNEIGDIVIEKEEKISDKLGVDDEFLQALNEGMSEYHEALKDLVER